MASSSRQVSLAPILATTTAGSTSESGSRNGIPAPSSTLNGPAVAAAQSSTSSSMSSHHTQQRNGLLDHIYNSFINGTCADVHLRVQRWGMVYHLHRSILVQAGFFHSLFLGGFSESTSTPFHTDPRRKVSLPTRSGSLHSTTGFDGGARKEEEEEEMQLVFDDDNITRAAFEICISRLYSTYPVLHVSPAILPTSSHPLTPSFPHSPIFSSSASLPPHTQGTTPRLLLSLLATAIYLGQNDIVKETLGLILGSVGPWSVGRYLEFAIGSGIGEEETEGEDQQPARGLEGVGRKVTGDPRANGSRARKRSDREEEPIVMHEEPEEEGQKCSVTSSPTVHPANRLKIKLDPGESGSMHDDSTSFDLGVRQYFYGFAGDKIGEACACWLARWAVDILEVEEAMAGIRHVESPPSVRPSMGRNQTMTSGLGSLTLGDTTPTHPTTPRSKRSKSVSWQPSPEEASTSSSINSTMDSHSPSTLCIWAHGGLPAHWVRAVISSDALFVKNEMERYSFAKRVVELRRLGRAMYKAEGVTGDLGVKEESEDGSEAEWDDEEEEEEAEFQEIFKSGIYYSHMSFVELSSMSSDINPYTGLPYVPLIVLQSALWAASHLQSRISRYRADGTMPDPKDISQIGHKRSATPTPSTESSSSRTAGLAYTTIEIITEIKEMTERAMSPRRANAKYLLGSRGRSSGRATPSPSPAPSSPLFQNGLGENPSPLEKLFWPVPTDSTLRIGDAISPTLGYSPSQALPDLGPQLGNIVLLSTDTGTGKEQVPLNEKLFFGIGPRVKTGREIESMWRDGYADEVKDTATWSSHEPFRFAVEFWGVAALGEKQRAYSTTQFYAGSYFNIYVQTIKKKDKGVQLGVYLHRQSMLEPPPAPSVPIPRPISTSSDWNASSPVVSSLSSRLGNDDLAMYRTMSFTPVGSPPASTSPGDGDDGPSRLNAVMGGKRQSDPPHSPYRDPRNVSRVYFSISCASALGTALTRFSSGPDNFSVSQSWGWKSSSLRSQEYLSSGEGVPSLSERLDGGVLGWVSDIYPASEGGWSKRDLRSLRATVVMGVL